MSFKNPKLELERKTYNDFAKKVAKRYVELHNFILKAPAHFKADINIRYEHGQMTENCDLTISYPLVGDPEMFRETNPERFNRDQLSVSDTASLPR